MTTCILIYRNIFRVQDQSLEFEFNEDEVGRLSYICSKWNHDSLAVDQTLHRSKIYHGVLWSSFFGHKLIQRFSGHCQCMSEIIPSSQSLIPFAT